MSSVLDIKRRIRSIESTQKITKALEMVSASKLRKSQNKVIAARPYAGKLKEVLGRLIAADTEFQHVLLTKNKSPKVAYIVIAGDRGLGGGYNANIFRFTEAIIKKNAKESLIIPVGRKSRDYFRRQGYTILQSYLNRSDDPTYNQARKLARELADFFISGEVGELVLVYTRFYSAISHQPVQETLLPIGKVEEAANPFPREIDYIYEPGAKEVLNILLPRYLETFVYRALVEAKASEHGARMTAMDAATSNAADIIKELSLSFNRARQASITKEITEIVSGGKS